MSLRVVVAAVFAGSVLVSCSSPNNNPVGTFYNGDPPPTEYGLCKNGTGWRSDNNGPRKPLTWRQEGDKVILRWAYGRGYESSTAKMVNGDMVFTPTSGSPNTFKRKSDKDC
jgi:hypothetical protein